MKLRAQITIILMFLALVLFYSSAADARPPEESEFEAAKAIGDDIAEWAAGLKVAPHSIGLFSVHVNAPFEQDYVSVMQTEILRGLTLRRFESVAACPECTAPQVHLEDDRLVVTKGVPDPQTLLRVAKAHPVDAFLTVDVFRTSLAVTAHVSLYSIPSGTLIGAEHFSAPTLNFAQSSVQVLLSYGVGTEFGEAPGTNSGTTFESAANLLLLEELGFAKGGLNLGAILGGPTTIIYMAPTLAFRGRFGRSALAWSFDLGAGFGFAGSDKGLAFRAAYEVYLGTIALIGLEGSYFDPQNSATQTQQGYVGLHIGLSFGR